MYETAKREILLIGSVTGWIGACWFGVCAFMMGWSLEDLGARSERTAFLPEHARRIASAARETAPIPLGITLLLRRGSDP